MSSAGRVFAVVALAVVASWCAPASAGASEGSLTVRPQVLRPGESVTVCGGGFSYAGDRVVTTGIDGLVGPHAEVRRDGRACVVLAFSTFRAPHERFVPLFLAAQGADGTFRTDRGRVFLSDRRLPVTGAVTLVAATSAAAASVLLGLLLLGLGRRRPRQRLSTSVLSRAGSG